MKIENRGENFSENLHALDRIFTNSYKSNQKAQKEHLEINNGYSSLPFKELNNNIGILQIALSSLKRILNDDNITIPAIQSYINDTRFLGHKVYDSTMIIKNDNDETLFDANRILGIIPSDERDLYTFKKTLKNEISIIENSLSSLQDSAILHDENIDFSNAKDYLTSNSSHFLKAHNTALLSAKLDALLA